MNVRGIWGSCSDGVGGRYEEVTLFTCMKFLKKQLAFISSSLFDCCR